MNGRAVLLSLLRFDQPLADIEAAVGDLDGEATSVAILTRNDICLVIRRHLAGLLGADEVARWATLIECRDDIEFEPRHEPAVADALFDLANPDLQGPLSDIGSDVLAMLER